MSRDFLGSTQGRSFRESPNRDRIARTGGYIYFVRTMAMQDSLPPAFHFAPVKFLNTDATPAPPGGMTVQNVNGQLVRPDGYSSILLQRQLLRVQSDYFGLLPLFENLRPDLIPGIFRFQVRVWGVCPLINPWISPRSEQFFGLTTSGGVNSQPFSVLDVNFAFTMNWPHFLPIAYPLANFVSGSPPLESRGLFLNMYDDASNGASAPEPKGLFEIDRIITWYGSFAGFTQNVSPDFLLPNYGRGVVSSALFGGAVSRSSLEWTEPNYTLRNPAHPVSVPAAASSEFVHPLDDGSHLFGTRPDTSIWRTIGLFVAFGPLVPVSSAGQLTVQHLKRNSLGPLRS